MRTLLCYNIIKVFDDDDLSVDALAKILGIFVLNLFIILPIFGIIYKFIYFITERTLVICDANEETKTVESDHAASDREVSPKLVMGSKKYGRRSRPTGHNTKNISLTDSDDDVDSNDHRSCDINVHKCLSSVSLHKKMLNPHYIQIINYQNP